jgi:hypothetical protein
MKRLVLGSTSDYLQRHARYSLLVLPRIPVSDTVEHGERASEATVGAAV